jgi:predicted DNA binding CopG/RHH family protein
MTQPPKPEDVLPPLDAEEAELLRSFEAGEWQPVPQMEQEITRYAAYARATLAAQKRVTIRLAEPDVQALQFKAREEGLSYHALLASILHKYATGQLVTNA